MLNPTWNLKTFFFSCLWLLWISHWNIFTMFYFTVLWNSTMYNSEFASSAMLVSKVFICVFSHMGQISGFYLCKFLIYSSSNIPSDFSVWNKSMKVGRQTCFQYIYCEKFYSSHYICSNFGSENFYVEQKGMLIWDAILPPSNISMLNNHHCQALFPLLFFNHVVMVEK